MSMLWTPGTLCSHYALGDEGLGGLDSPVQFSL